MAIPAIKPAASSPPAADRPRRHYLNADYSVASWLLTVDHKRIAVLYLISILVFFALGGSSPPASASSC
jgi:cytochrome c oxidase subunit 1